MLIGIMEIVERKHHPAKPHNWNWWVAVAATNQFLLWGLAGCCFLSTIYCMQDAAKCLVWIITKVT